jgi:hypothetical protein
MTIPIERSFAILNTREFLRSLLDPKETPRVPKWIRTEALWCLKHYPNNVDMDRARDLAPKVFGTNKEFRDED